MSASNYGQKKAVWPDGRVMDVFPQVFVLDDMTASAANGFKNKVAYCIEPDVLANDGDVGNIQSFSEFSASDASSNSLRGNTAAYQKLNWIAHNAYPAKSMDEIKSLTGISGGNYDQNLKDILAGTNFAIWHFSHGLDFSQSKLPAAAQAVYDYYIGPANVGKSGVDATNQTGMIFNNGRSQDGIIVDNENPHTGETPTTEPSTPEETTPEQTTSEETTTEETTTEQTTEQTTEPSESTTEETTSKTTEPSTEPSTEPTTKPSEPTTEPTPLNPSISTMARLDGTQVKAGAVVNDTVTYKDLVPGKTYTLDAQLINKANEQVIGEGSATFTPEKADGETSVKIVVNDDVDGIVKAAVAFETLTSAEVNADGSANETGENTVIAEHKDINDKAQTVNSTPLQPEIATQATLNGNEIAAGSTVTDTVTFKDLVPGKTYTLNAELINKADKQVIGQGTVEFIPETSSGKQNVEIAINDDVTEPVASAVAFETLTSAQVNKDGSANETGENTVIAEHKDINDKAQTVTGETPETPTTTPGKPGESTEPSTQPSTPEETTEPSTQPSEPTTEPTPLNPEIKTVARLDGTQVKAGAVVNDTVTYKDLVPGKSYTLNAQLINKANEQVIGEGTATFTPKEANGETSVKIVVNDDVTVPVASAVAYETLTSAEVNADGSANGTGENTVIAEHKDLNDKDQTVIGKTLQPSIATQATLNGDEVIAGSTVSDTVTYKDLVVGATYTLDAQLVDKA
ncbi:MAG: VaFE repeat-containing surface-anchored protein, partial [Corynebacterium sp.]|uniref:VaFE repeat-containing surface-anchored protein n=1 Tax=Corynebacterium sp. TaxID=1720 RepID=UPI0026DBAF9F